jgi:uncharacterized protein YeeX (DUF496 family)
MKTSTRNILLGVMLVVGFFAARYTIGLATQLRTHIDEDMVYAHYQKQINAMRMYDAKTLCAMLHPRFRGMDVIVVGKKEERIPSNRDSNCAETRTAMAQMREIYEATKQPPDLKYTIQSVTLSEDRRQASVRLKFEMTVGNVFTASGDTLETLTRERGKVYLLSSQSRGTVKEL